MGAIVTRSVRPRSRLAPLAAAAFGLGWFLLQGGGPALHPAHVGWLLRAGDPAQHWLGWAFFREEPWRLPLGAVTRFAEPLGSTVGFTDAVPVAALLGRLASSRLPPDFQYLGAWLALSFALQGFFGARLSRAMGGDGTAQFLTGALFSVAPPLLWRVGHEALTAHWLLLALLAITLEPAGGARSVRRGLAAAAALALLGATIHPTLGASALALAAAVASSFAAQRALRPSRAVVWLGLVVLGDAAVLALLGYWGTPLPARGFGYFSADLLTFVNPMGWSRLLPSWPTRTPGQGEGYAYLGAGGLAVLGLAVGSCFRPRRAPFPWRRLTPIIAVCVALGLIAVSTYVTAAGRKVLGTSDLPPALQAIVGPFRASGRFIWPLHYLVLSGAVAGTLSLFERRPRAARLVLVAALGLQVVDVGTGRFRGHFAPGDVPSLEGWSAEAAGRRHMALFPPHVRNSDGEGCGAAFGPREVALAYRAYRLGLGFNSGYLSRMDLGRARAACAALSTEVDRGRLRDDTLYVPDAGSVGLLTRAGATCRALGGEDVCVAGPAARSSTPRRRGARLSGRPRRTRRRASARSRRTRSGRDRRPGTGRSRAARTCRPR